MENISIVLSDLDGTLFRNDKSISEYSKKIIQKIQKQGILFGICTSRAYVNAYKFLDGIKPDIFISNGGGMVRLGDKIIYESKFSIEEIRKLIDTAFKIFGAEVVLSADNENALYSNSKDELIDKFWTYNDFSDFKEPVMKMCIETLDREKVSKVVSSLGEDKIDYLPFSDIPWYKLSPKNATKEKAIEALCNYLKILPDNIAAFGDDFSDIGMLKFCGKGIAMKNAINQVKIIANEICLSNEEDGVARWLEKNVE